MSGAGRRALILGLGRFGGGREAARFLSRRGWQLRIADRAPAESLTDSVRALADLDGTEWRLGSEDTRLVDGVDLVVANPAVPDDSPMLAAARSRGVELTQEIDLFLAHYPGQVALVTGTNGKSTTATLTAGALRAAGLRPLCGGNIGHSLLADEADWRADQVAVVEISSFQLERLDPRARVAAAVMTRVTRDHLDRHGTLAAYHAAKSRAAAAATGCLVFGADDEVAGSFASPAAVRRPYRHGRPRPGEVGCEDGWILSALPSDPGRVVHADALELLGAFHVENVMAAYAAAAFFDVDRHTAGLSLAQTPPLPYRLQLTLTAGGVRLFENSVSTEIQSTLSAVTAIEGGVHWVGGGKSKDGDFAGVAHHLAPHLCTAHLFGASAGPMARELSGRVPTTAHQRLEDALESAWRAARPGDAVLFSPAFASFDQYPNFRARAEAFHAWTRDIRSCHPDAGHAISLDRESRGSTRCRSVPLATRPPRQSGSWT